MFISEKSFRGNHCAVVDVSTSNAGTAVWLSLAVRVP